MNYEIQFKPSYAMTTFTLDAGERVNAEAGSMVAMTAGMDIKTRMNRSIKPNAGFLRRAFGVIWGFFVAMLRRTLGGESFFVNTFTATSDGSELIVAPALTGDMIHYSLQGQRLFVQAGSYVASTPGVELKLKWGGFKSFFASEGFALLQATGTGDLFVNSYGGIVELPVDGTYIVDTGHIVAFEDTLHYKVKRIGSWKATLFSGEGLVVEFSGHGKLFVQTRNLSAFSSWIAPLLP